ncbi:hypothetical protein Clacol_003065 [Clathrus columnatus]|uniref:Uncharacterized protein n=1 Tax=Clathrus columnatus TaxID=1419009 RepID=A0AAV5A759_9AGAM|nr:hypothetical protein Clacol_003065 [Clathrus columnatus]
MDREGSPTAEPLETKEKELLSVEPTQRAKNEMKDEWEKGLEEGEGTEDEDFPIGEEPTWKELEYMIRKAPMTMIRVPKWREDLNSDAMASDIFISFTRDYWVSMLQNFLSEEKYPPAPKTVQEAIEVWSVGEVQRRIKQVIFASKYHEIYRKTNDAGRKLLGIKLKQLLGHLQRLPEATKSTESTRGHLWTYGGLGNGIRMLTNPKLYKIRGLRNEKLFERAATITGGWKEIRVRLLAADKGISLEDSRKGQKMKRARDRRSAKSKNKRQPPQRKKS